MIHPDIPIDEKERLESLDSFSILDTLPEKDYDEITAIAAQICETPISLISLVDDKRQWFKSHHGIGASETPKEYAFCAHAINDPSKPLIVKDARTDERFHDNPLVVEDPHVIFYAGMPLTTNDGHAMGTLCVIDHEPKELTTGQVSSLKALSNQVMKLLELRATTMRMQETYTELQQKNDELSRFAYVAAHDLKAPLINISSMAEMFVKQHSSEIDENGSKIMDLLIGNADKLKHLVDELLKYARSDNFLIEDKTSINLLSIEQQIHDLLPHTDDLSISIKQDLDSIKVNFVAFQQILLNLISNSVKYSDKPKTDIEIEVTESKEFYHFSLKDNGPGIDKKFHKKVFELFQVLIPRDRFGNKGTGLGLATVKKLITKMGGSISIDSKPGEGTTFHFSILK